MKIKLYLIFFAIIIILCSCSSEGDVNNKVTVLNDNYKEILSSETQDILIDYIDKTNTYVEKIISTIQTSSNHVLGDVLSDISSSQEFKEYSASKEKKDKWSEDLTVSNLKEENTDKWIEEMEIVKVCYRIDYDIAKYLMDFDFSEESINEFKENFEELKSKIFE